MAGKKKKKTKDGEVEDFKPDNCKPWDEMDPEELAFTKKLPEFFHPKPTEEVVMVKFNVKLPGGRNKQFEKDKNKTTIGEIRSELADMFKHRLD